MLLKAVIVWIGIALAETGHGILRVRLLNPRIGDRMARRVSVLTGSVIVATIGWFTIPWIGVASVPQSFAVGGLWLILMLGFDLGLGRFAFGLPWSRLRADFDLRQGGLLGVGMLFLFLTPWLVARLRGLV